MSKSTGNVEKKMMVDDTRAASTAVDIFIVAVLGFFPLFLTNSYYNILESKYYFYIGSVFLLVISLLVAAFKERQSVKQYFSGFALNKFVKRFSITDIALLLFLLIAVISTITSDYVYESFWGNEGRFSGLFLLGLYGISYFCVTRYGKLKRWHLDVFLMSGLLVCLFGITHFFKLDLFHLKTGMIEGQKLIFTSTIGNINTYTAIVGMIMAVAAVLFASCDISLTRRLYYLICLMVSFFALVMGISDNALLSLGALLAFLPFYLFTTKKGIYYYFIIIAVFLTVLQIISYISAYMGDKVAEIESIFGKVMHSDILIWIVLILWILIVLWYVFNSKITFLKDENCSKIRIFWFFLLVLSALCLGYAIYDVNINENVNKYNILSQFLVFNDDWGTNRGYIWRNAMECYQTFSPWKKIVGFGPDTFGIVLLDKTSGNVFGQVFDNAHNEYLHYLITVGISGLAAYVVFLISFIIKSFVKKLKDPLVMSLTIAVICYAVQATVNLNLPISTPIMWMLLSLGALGCSQKPNCN